MQKLNRNLLLSVIFLSGTLVGFAKKQKKIPKAEPVEDIVHFNNQEIPEAPAPQAGMNLPDFGENQDSYSHYPASNAEYFRVPEIIREKRDIARRVNLKKAQIVLFDYLRTQREKLFPKEYQGYEEILREHKDFLVEMFFQKNSDDQAKLLEGKFKTNPELKSALTYFGLIRLHGIHGRLGTMKQVPVPRAVLASLEVGGAGEAELSYIENYEAAPNEVLDAQAVEAAFHRFVPTGKRYDPYRDFVKKFSANGVHFSFTKEQTDSAAAEIRSIGLDLIWDLKEKILPEKAAEIAARFSELRNKYAPYDRIYIDVFKQNAMAEGSPEFLVIWRSNATQQKYRKELLALGLITTGKETSSRWAPYGAKGAPGNTPDGVWKVFGFDKHYISQAGDDMRGLVQLSYGVRKAFSGRGFHHVFFWSPWGTNASHGCFRVFTGESQQGLANVIWSAINPHQLDNVDYTDFGNDSDNDRNKETQSIREVVRYIRENVWVSNFSEHEDGYSFTGNATYSTQIRQQYENHRAVSGVSVLAASYEILRGDQKIVGPMRNDKKGKPYIATHFGQYWVYNKEVRERAFDINLRK